MKSVVRVGPVGRTCGSDDGRGRVCKDFFGTDGGGVLPADAKII